MTEKMQAKLNELEIQQKVIQKIDELIHDLERSKEYALKTYDMVEVTDENGDVVLDEEGNPKRDWKSRPYTEEELKDNPSVFREIAAYDLIISALEKLA